MFVSCILVLKMLQIFNIFPITGYTAKDPRLINRKKSFLKIFLNNTLFVWGICEFVLLIRAYTEKGVTIVDFPDICFYLSTLYAVYALRSLSHRWRSFILYWHNMEKSLLDKYHNNYSGNNNKSDEYNPRLVMKITMITTILLCLAIIDHVFFVLDEKTDATQLYQQCNVTQRSSWEFLLYKFRPQYFILFEYHPVLFLPVEWVHICLSFAWSMQDTLIIVISLVLTERFSQWNARVSKYEELIIPGRIWYELREDYTCLTELVTKVDEYLSTMVLISCASNLYQICSCVFQSSM